MISYHDQAANERKHAEASRIIGKPLVGSEGANMRQAPEGYDIPAPVRNAATVLKQGRETIPQFLERIGYTR